MHTRQTPIAIRILSAAALLALCAALPILTTLLPTRPKPPATPTPASQPAARDSFLPTGLPKTGASDGGYGTSARVTDHGNGVLSLHHIGPTASGLQYVKTTAMIGCPSSYSAARLEGNWAPAAETWAGTHADAFTGNNPTKLRLLCPYVQGFVYSGYPTLPGFPSNFAMTTDGKTFTNWPVTFSGYGTLASFRDISVIRHAGEYWAVGTHEYNSKLGTFSLYRSGDGHAWTFVQALAVGTGKSWWAPEWFTDSDGSLHVIISGSTTPDTGAGFTPYELHPTTTDLAGPWSTAVAITGEGFPSSVIDLFLIKAGSTYFLYYKNNAGSNAVEVSTSSSPFSGYTVLHTGDWAGWGVPMEGPQIVPLGGNSYRIYLDATTGDRLSYSDSTDGMATWSTLTSCAGGTAQHHGGLFTLYGSEANQPTNCLYYHIDYAGQTVTLYADSAHATAVASAAIDDWASAGDKTVTGTGFSGSITLAADPTEDGDGTLTFSAIYLVGDLVEDSLGAVSTGLAVTAATKASPARLTFSTLTDASGLTLRTGDLVIASGFTDSGWTGLNGNYYWVRVDAANKYVYLFGPRGPTGSGQKAYTIDYTDLRLDSSAFGTWTSGGTLKKCSFYWSAAAHVPGDLAAQVARWTENPWTASAAYSSYARVWNYSDLASAVTALNAAGGYGGYADWRLPNAFELMATMTLPTWVPLSAFPAENCASWYWSATYNNNLSQYFTTWWGWTGVVWRSSAVTNSGPTKLVRGGLP